MSVLTGFRRDSVSDPQVHQYSVGSRGTDDVTFGTLELTVSGPDSGAFTIEADNVSGATVAPGEARTFRLRFDPDTAGTYLATVAVPSNDPDGRLFLFVTGEVVDTVDTEPGIAVDPTSWDFGSVDTATGSAVKVFVVSSTGTESLVMGTVAIGGAGAAAYSKSADGVSGATIPVGESRSVTITFNPSSDGAKVGTLTFPGTGVTSVVAPLTGTGTTGAPAPDPTEVSRFYLSRLDEGISYIDPVSGRWDRSQSADGPFVLSPVRSGPAVAYGETVNHSGVSGQRIRLGSWVSPPLAAQEIDTTFRCYAIGYRASDLGSNVTSALRFAVLRDADDTIDWGSILSTGDAGGSAWASSANPLPRRFPRGEDYTWPLVLTIEEGDRLIVELGARAFSTSHNGVRMRWGGASSTTDLLATQTEQSLTLAPWIEFADPLLVLP